MEDAEARSATIGDLNTVRAPFKLPNSFAARPYGGKFKCDSPNQSTCERLRGT